MMTNLFSSFDPSTSFFTSLNWILFILSMYWLIPSRWNFLWIKMIMTLHNKFKILLNNNIKGSTLIFISLFSLILFYNFLGLFPYIFTSTSHLILTLSLSLPLWMSFMIYGWTNNTMHMFAHLVPQGTPSMLMPFMVCIETISNIIRPGCSICCKYNCSSFTSYSFSKYWTFYIINPFKHFNYCSIIIINFSICSCNYSILRIWELFILEK